MNSTEHPGIADLREMDVLRFLFELKREQIDPMKLQEMLIEHQIQNQVRHLMNNSVRDISDPIRALSSSSQNSLASSPATSMFSTATDNSMIPEPKIVFNYVSSPKFPTPTTTPEPSDEPIDYTTCALKKEDFHTKNRSQFIKLKKTGDLLKAPLTPASSARDSDSDQENTSDNTQLKKLETSSKIKNWCGSSIYNNLPELVMTEYDKILRESHELKVEVIKEMNKEFPVNYEYNPKKSRIRTNYADPQIADDRTKNNIASRRSRQRKKFQVQVIQYSVDYDEDENFLLGKQEQWLQSIITNLEQKVLNDSDGSSKLRKLRKQCGFE